MPKVYFTEHAVVSLGTATAVHELPFGQRIVSGVTPPAAAGGTKQLSAKARMRIEAMATAGRDYRLQAVAGMRITPTVDLHLANNPLDGILRMRITMPRCELTAGAGGAAIAQGAVGTAAVGNNAAVTANAPTRAVDDLLICLATSRSTAGTISPSSGWTNEGVEFGGGTYLPTKFYWRWATNTSADNITVTPSGGTTGDTIIARIYVYQNVNKATGPFVGQTINSIAANIINYCDSINNENIGDTTQFLRDIPHYFTTNPYSIDVPAGSHILFGIQEDNDATGVTGCAVTNDSRNTTAEKAFTFNTDGFSASATGNDATQYMFRGPNPSTEITNFNAQVQITRAIGAAGGSLNQVTTVLKSLTVAPNVAVWLNGTLKQKFSAVMTLSSNPPKTLDGTLHNKVTLTGDLDRRAGTFIDGLLPMKITPQCTLTIGTPPGHLDGIIRMRMVGNVAVLSVGTTHKPTGLLPVKWSANAILTINYMQIRATIPWRVWCDLSVTLKLGSTASMKQTATATLTRGPGTGGGFAGLHWTGTARLYTPLRGVGIMHMIALALTDVQRRLAGSAQERVSTPGATLSVVRTFGGSAGVRQTAGATLTVVRSFGGRAAMRMTASGGALTSDRRLAASASILWRAYLDLQTTRPTRPPETDITVSPYTSVVDSEFLPVQVESPDDNVHVEEP